jgi:hypothetical protein
MKLRIAFVAASLAGLGCLCVAQSSKSSLSSSHSGSDPLKSATKPITPKSANTPPHTSAASAPAASTGGRKTNAELTHLEGQGVRGGTSSKSGAGAAKAPPIGSSKKSSGNGSGINATYKKPYTPKK